MTRYVVRLEADGAPAGELHVRGVYPNGPLTDYTYHLYVLGDVAPYSLGHVKSWPRHVDPWELTRRTLETAVLPRHPLEPSDLSTPTRRWRRR